MPETTMPETGSKRTWRQRFKASYELVRQDPHVVVIPVVVFAVFCGLGIYGVFAGAWSMEEQSRSTATYEISIAAEAVQLEVQRAAVLLGLVADYVRYQPGFWSLNNTWAATSASFWKAAPRGASLMFLAPQGIVNFTQPASYLSTVNGLDLLGPSSPYRDSFTSAMANQTYQLTLAGPALGDWQDRKSSYLAFIQPIFINASSITFRDMPYQSSYCNATSPTAKYCYNATSNERWWGVAAMAAETKLFLKAIDTLTNLITKGYQFQIGPNTSDVLGGGMAYGTSSTRPTNALYEPVKMVDTQWELYVWKDSWSPRWVMPLIAVVVAGSLLISMLLFAVLYSRAEHKVLLHTLLPKSTIARMRDQLEWTRNEHQEEVLRELEIETPARHMLVVIAACLEDQHPPVQLLLSVRDALHRTADVYRPAAADLKGRLQASSAIDAEVRQALVTQLMDDSSEASEDGVDTQQSTVNWGHQLLQGKNPGDQLNSHPSTISVLRDSNTNPAGERKHLSPGSTAAAELEAGDASPDPAAAKGNGSHTSNGSPFFLGRLDSGHSATMNSDMLGHRLSVTDMRGHRLSGNANQLRIALMALMYQAGQSKGPESQAVSHSGLEDFHMPPQLGPASQASLGPKAGPAELGRVSGRTSGLACKPRKLALQEGDSEARAGEGGQADMQLIGTAMCNSAGYVVPAPRRAIWTQLEAVLSSADDWGFDAYALEEASCGHPLSVLGYYLINHSGLISWGCMDSARLTRFLQNVEDGYPSANPYHNQRHAAEVLQAMHMLVTRGGLMPGYVDQCGMLACYLAAIVHDYEHKGRNNDYLVNSHDELAVRYNDKSPMENHHLAAAWNLLRRPELNCLSGLPKATWLKLRKLMIELVLATDMKQHFAILGQFDALHRSTASAATSEKGTSQGNAPEPQHQPQHQHQAHTTSEAGNSAGSASTAATLSPAATVLVPASDNDKTLSLQMALKCADLANLAAPLHVYLKWVRCLEEEFFQQGDAERAAGLPLSPLCDRTKAGVSKSQVGFFDFVACPLFKAFTARFPASSPMLNTLMANYKYWQIATLPSQDSSVAEDDTPGRTSRPSSKA